VALDRLLDQVEGRVTLDVRAMGPADFGIWADMAHALWPEVPRAALLRDIETRTGPGYGERRGFLAEEDGVPLGFAEISLRPYANGCEFEPVAFLEGIWVAPDARRRGVGRALIAHLTALVRDEGRRELCSDALLDNLVSHAAHRGWGFVETERVVYFRVGLD
jgi:aminoglycoside 6'-N-acetyltransferase I